MRARRTRAGMAWTASAAIIGIVNGPTTAERIRRAGAAVWTQDEATFTALLRGELDKWGAVIRGGGRRLE